MNDVFYSNKTPLETSSQGTVQPSENIINSSILPNVLENATNGVYNGDTGHSRYFRDLFNQYALYLWLLGIIIALTVNLTGYARFSKHLKQANKPATDEENRILASLLNGRNNVRLVRNRFVTTPMLIGILRPYIIIPDINFNEKQLKNILLHEIAHLKHFNIGVKWLTMIAASIHWFNPLMYFIKKEINHACELACDEAVIKDFNPTEKQAYGDTLISVVSENKYPIGVLQATMSEEKETLKERLVAIMKYNKKSKSIILMSIVLLIAFISGAVLLGACSGKAAAAETQSTEQLSEQPNKELFDKYFSDIRLGSVFLLGGNVNLKEDRNTFLPHQKVCFNAGFKYKKNFLFRTEIFNLGTNDFIERYATTISSEGSDGLSNEGILFPVGKYDYLIYIENTLVAVLPFEVISYVDYFFGNLREEK